MKMKKLAITLTAFAALTGSAFAADLPARTYSKAPVMVATPSWTGFYIFGGVGGGIWDANDTVKVTATGVPVTINQKQGGDGWYGTVGAGYDWQFNSSWVFGILADGQFGSLRGNIVDQLAGLQGSEKLRDTWAVGARLGYLVAPNVLSYVNAGWTGSSWSGTTLVSAVTGIPSGLHTNGYTTNSGVFVGGGVENNLNIFGISAPGWFMKTEYRAAYYGNKNLSELNAVNAPVGFDISTKPLVQTISTSLVYRFNWSGPLVAKY
jgi:outer membrane immunogenic protein